jgi:nucleoside phosphorylase/CheY-like chemotaxis protein
MKILIVDDREAKVHRLVSALKTCPSLSADNILVAHCANDARRLLRTASIDLLVLDILLPLRENDTPTIDTSLTLLQELTEEDFYRKPDYILGLTAYPDAASIAEPRFKEWLWTLVHYDETSDEWIAPICNAISYISKTRNFSNRKHYETDLCIVTALDDPELTAVHRIPWRWDAPEPLDDTNFVRRGRIVMPGAEFSVVSASAARMGMVATALLSASLASHYKPRFMAMVGICAGIVNKTRLGDVIFADPTWDWQSGKRIYDKGVSRFAIAPHQLDVPEFLRVRAKQFSGEVKAFAEIRREFPNYPGHELRMLLGPVASGSVVLADGQVVEEIRQQHRSLLGIEMESYGMFAACASAAAPRPTAFALKSVCDFADQDKDDTMQAYAAYTSAAALRVFMERYLGEIIELAGT